MIHSQDSFFRTMTVSDIRTLRYYVTITMILHFIFPYLGLHSFSDLLYNKL
jgi:hypothetical protein